MPTASQAQLAYHDRPPALDSIRGRYGGERVGHSDLVAVLVEHQRMRIVQAPPAGNDVSAVETQPVAHVGRGGCSAKLHEHRIRGVTKHDIGLLHARDGATAHATRFVYWWQTCTCEPTFTLIGGWSRCGLG